MLRTPIIGWIYNDIQVYLEEIGSEKLTNWFILYMGLISIMFFAGFALHTHQGRIQESTEDMLNPEEPLGRWTYSIYHESNEDVLNPEELLEHRIDSIYQESTMHAQVENLTRENQQLKTKVSTLETDMAVLEKKIVEMEEVNAAAKDESPASPKQVDEEDVSNETHQESVSAEESTTSPTKEASSDVPTAETTESQNAAVPVEESKIAEDVTEPPTPVATKDLEEPTNSSSDAMEKDAPAPEQEFNNRAA